MEFEIFELGLIDFKEAWDIQKEVFYAVKNRKLSSALLLCRHYPVITLGRSAKKKNILVGKDELDSKSIAVYEIERGGDVTYHGPGQLIGYPIFDLGYIKKDINFFLRRLEDITINLLQRFGIKGVTYKGLTGVWIGKQKISSIGIAIRNWITFHGLSINIKKDDLDNFKLIKPCGMNVGMISLEDTLNRNPGIDFVAQRLIQEFRKNF